MVTGKRTIYHLLIHYSCTHIQKKKPRALALFHTETKRKKEDLMMSLFTPIGLRMSQVSELCHTKEFGSFIPFGNLKMEIRIVAGHDSLRMPYIWLYCFTSVPWTFILHNFEHMLWFRFLLLATFAAIINAAFFNSLDSSLGLQWIFSPIHNCNLLKYFQ